MSLLEAVPMQRSDVTPERLVGGCRAVGIRQDRELASAARLDGS